MKANPNKMSEKERIDFIRDNGSEAQKAGLKAIFGNNQYKPKRMEMWNTRLKKGKRMVQTIVEKNNGGYTKSKKKIKKKKKSKKGKSEDKNKKEDDKNRELTFDDFI